MTSIPEFMTTKHRECDEFFIAAENAVADNNWSLAKQTFSQFSQELELHLQAEETILFPEFEQATGITQGPTQVMRGEHQQMRALAADLLQALGTDDKEAYIGTSENINGTDATTQYERRNDALPDDTATCASTRGITSKCC